MDLSLPRDYKVFDVNLSISPLFSKEEETCKACIHTLPQLCEK